MSRRRSSSPLDEVPALATGDEASGRLSYRERREEADALGSLARALVELRPSQLREVTLPDELRQEIERCRDFRKGARNRQLRRISQLLRRVDVAAVQEATTDAGHRQRRRAERERIYEHWRQRLLDEGDAVLTELVTRYPGVDAQRLRQRLRRARQQPDSERGRQARRDVLRIIREAVEASPAIASTVEEFGVQADFDAEGSPE